jgi:hypothetical protein
MSSTEHGQQVVRKSGASSVARPDRRVRRTRKLLHDAFLALIIEKGYELWGEAAVRFRLAADNTSRRQRR